MKNRNIGKSILINMLVLILLAILSIGYAWIIGEYRRFKIETKLTKEELTEKEKEILITEVNRVLDYIKLKKSQTEIRLKTDVKSRTYEAYSIALNIYNENKDKKREVIEKMITDALRPISFNDGRGYFFIVDLQGVEKLYPIFPEFEGKNLLNLQDLKGNYIIRDEIALINEKREGYIEGFWKKPESSSSKIYKKISFIKKFEVFDWYIGTGEYVDDVEKSIQKEVAEYISSIRYGNMGLQYIFVSDYKGIEKINGMFPEFVGKNLWNLEDATGRKIVQDGIKMAIESESGDFISQYWYNLEGNGTSEKLSFMKKFSEWEWIIGTGVYLDTINQNVLDKEEELRERIKVRIIYIILIMFILIIISLIAVRILSDKINSNLNLFFDFFKKASNDYKEMPLEKFTYTELKELAKSANNMIKERKLIDEEIKEINEDLQKIVNDRESKLKNINKNLERLIEIKSNKLVEISRQDYLTKLYNKRYILGKLKEEISSAKINNKSLSVLLIDLDSFKNINSLHGYSLGDKVLEKVGECILNSIKNSASAGRYGGGEFLIIMPETTIEEAYQSARDLVSAIKKLTKNMNIALSINSGVAEFEDDSLTSLIDKVDYKLSQSKKNDKNKVEK